MKKCKVISIVIWIMSVLNATAQISNPILDGSKQAYLQKFGNTITDVFFDQGSWFGVSLPENNLGLGSPLIWGGNGKYELGKPLLFLSYGIDGEPIDLKITNTYLPGKLLQQASQENTSIRVLTVFVNSQMALLAYTFSNHSDKSIIYDLNWSVSSGDNLIDNHHISRHLSNAEIEMNFEQALTKKETNTFASTIVVPANDSITNYIAIQYRFKDESELKNIDFKTAPLVFLQNTERWYGYLIPYKNFETKKQLLAVKCIETLTTNWKNHSGELKHSGLFPSIGTFKGFWSWDAWKHAVALVNFEPSLAKEQIEALFDYQNDEGMIPDVVFREGYNNWRDTKPPLSAWAVYEVFKTTKDTSFVKEMFPKLLKYHQWWYKNRDNNKNGLCEFGSTDGTLEAAKWESGMDNAIRFDKAKMLQNGNDAWSFDQESVDLNAYLFAEKKYLVALAKVLNENDIARKFEKEILELKKKIQTVFYDKESGYFYDYNFKTKSLIKIIGPEAWTVLWAGAASDIQAKHVVEKIMNPEHFNTFLPFPTVSASNSSFDPENGYWRGLVWIDQAYFALTGMKKYGYKKQALEMQEKLLTHAEGLLEKQMPIRENYNPKNGTGLGAKHFSWSAAHFLMLLNEIE